jgi:hypothetical protein
MRVLKSLGARYGVGRLLMIVGENAGFDKIAEACAREIGIHCIVVPTLHNCYYRQAGKLASEIKVSLEPEFMLAFYWGSLRDGSVRDVRDAAVLARRAGVRVKPIKVPMEVGMMGAAAWQKRVAEKRAGRRKKKR